MINLKPLVIKKKVYIATVFLNRPADLNIITDQMMVELVKKVTCLC